MNIYYLTSPERGLDTYDGHVVIAPDEATARRMVPCADECPARRDGEDHACVWHRSTRSTCECIGQASEGADTSVVMSTFNAG